MRTTTFSKINRLQVFYLDDKRLIKYTAKQAMDAKTHKVMGLASSVVVRVPTPCIWETM